MINASDHWMVPLENKPTVLEAGVGVHGQNPVERFRFHEIWIVDLYHSPADLFLDGRRFPIDRGCACLIAPGTLMEYHFHVSHWIDRYAYFSLPADFGRSVSVPVVQDLGSDFEEIDRQFERAIGCFRTRPRWAEAKIWDILWELADRSPLAEDSPSRFHPALQKTLETIELNLADPIGAAELAERAGISYTHLAHLFKQSLGATVSQYVRRRRIERARHMLQYSSLSIKAIAAQVGFQDLHVFNKAVHKELGKSPTDVRRE